MLCPKCHDSLINNVKVCQEGNMFYTVYLTRNLNTGIPELNYEEDEFESTTDPVIICSSCGEILENGTEENIKKYLT